MGKILNFINNWRVKWGKWFWIFLGVCAVIIWRIVAASNKPIKVETSKAGRGDLVQTVSTSGSVKADRYSALSFQTGGKVVWVGVKVGQTVKKGQALASLDTVPLDAAYRQAMNNYRKYQATAENILDQVKNHASDESFTQKDTRTTAEVNRDNAYDAVRSAESDLRNATIFAPFAGVMDTVSPSSPGINVILGAANYTIVDPSSVYFDAEVEETDLPNVKVGQAVDIKLDAYPETLFQGRVETIGMVAFVSSTGGNSYHIRISLPENIDQKFRVGMGGDVNIVYNSINDVLKISSSAIVTDTDNFVWVAKNNRAKKVKVETGGSSIEETEIRTGLSGDEVIINQPPNQLKEGSRVEF